MGTIAPPDPVKSIFGVLYREREIWEQAMKRIETHFGPIDFISEEFPFVETDYYDDEMGKELTRRYLSLETLMPPDQLTHRKQLSNLWEEQFAQDGKRRINLDPGYLTPASLILASTKNFFQRVYIGRGIYAEVTMHYARGDFHKLLWTYPDYYNHKDVFQQIRVRFRQQLKALYIDKSNE
ncbi:MAG: DUF4416 family protein [Candidatus Omnitrophota bacterium]|jgi:hypothetical protein|nr:MAG: DUF4416 family protein [Candidatus Omnitrophota bacterium]